MKVAVLFSGGKDSCLAMLKAMEKNEVVCLISIVSKNPESYMFHVPNINITKAQAEAIGLPSIQQETEGRKEEELNDLKKAMERAKKEYKIRGVVTGAIRSNYQASRIKKICKELNLKTINPLWGRDQIALLNEIVEKKFTAIISGVFAYPLGRELHGKTINKDIIKKLEEMQKKYEINPAGEGGEIETTVLDAPFFKKKIEVTESEVTYEKNSGVFKIKRIKLIKK
ncbi:MAG: TIGR00289 family protein [Candidatus Nanoarchaeia archaeon]